MSSCYSKNKYEEIKEMSRPGGNPEIAKYSFKQKYEWDEPCSAKMTLRLPPSLYKQIKQVPDWQEEVRQAIALIVESEKENISPQEKKKNA
jgi:hypothetical protein